MLSSIHPFSASYKSHSSQIPSFSKEYYSSPQHLEKLNRSSNEFDSTHDETSTISKIPKSYNHQHRNSFNLKHRPNSIFFAPGETSKELDSYRIENLIDKAIATGKVPVDLSNQDLYTIPSCIKKLELPTSSPWSDKPNHQQNPPIPTSRHRTLNRVSSAPSSVFNSYTANQTANQSTGLNLILSNNRLTDIKPLISNLKSISTLSLRSNRIEIIPEEIQELNQLKELNIANNQIKFLPSSILNLIQKNKCILRLSGNPWLKKPTKTSKLPNLSKNRIISQPINHHPTITQTLQKNCIRRLCIKENTEEKVLETLTIEDLNQANLSPDLLNQIINPIESFWKCDQCEIWNNQNLIECFEWIQIIEMNKEIVPIQFKFCNQICLEDFFNDSSSNL